MSIDVSKSFRDISLSFTKHPVTNDILILKNEDAIKKSVSNIIRTTLGEKFFNLRFGTSIYDRLFENADFDVAYAIEDEIKFALKNYEPRIQTTQVIVQHPSDSNDLNVQVSYDIIGMGISPQKLDFILSPARI
jgi:phage baseplate assembly protein W